MRFLYKGDIENTMFRTKFDNLIIFHCKDMSCYSVCGKTKKLTSVEDIPLIEISAAFGPAKDVKYLSDQSMYIEVPDLGHRSVYNLDSQLTSNQ